MSSRCAVYDVYVDGSLWYVGMSKHPEKRLKEHQSIGQAPRDAVVVIVSWHMTRKKARQVEQSRIWDKRPPANFMKYYKREKWRPKSPDMVALEERARRFDLRRGWGPLHPVQKDPPFDAMQADRDAGKSVREIAARYGCSQGTVQKWTVRRAGPTPRAAV